MRHSELVGMTLSIVAVLLAFGACAAFVVLVLPPLLHLARWWWALWGLVL